MVDEGATNAPQRGVVRGRISSLDGVYDGDVADGKPHGEGTKVFESGVRELYLKNHRNPK